MATGRLEGKVAIVTGGGRGIGLAITRAFVREAACVAVGEIRDELRDALPAPGQQTLFVRADVSEEPQVQRLVSAAVARFGRLDVLEPEDIAGAAVFLASDEASFITGTHLRVDGGREALLHSFSDIIARPFQVEEDLTRE